MNRLTSEERKMIKLLPCPFCGSECQNTTPAIDEFDGESVFWITCETCGSTGERDRTEYHAIEKWNRRYKP